MVKKLLNKYHELPITVKASIWFVICSVLQRSISVITTPIFTRLMTEAQYGQFSVYNAWLQILTIITTLRLNYAVFNKGMSKFPDNRDEYTSTLQTITSVLVGICLIVYLFFSKWINEVTELSTFVTLAMFVELFFAPAISFWSCRKRYDFQYKSIVIVTLLIAVLNAGLGVLAVCLAEEKGIARILSCVLVQITIGCVLYFSTLGKSKKKFVKQYAKFALLFNLPLVPHYFSVYIMDQFDRIMIQKMGTLSQVAIYSIGYNAGFLIKIVTNSINNSLVPWLYRNLETGKIKEVEKNIYPILMFVSAVILGFIVFAPEFVFVFAGKKYANAVYVVPPIALSVLFIFTYTIFANIEFFYDENKFTMYISMAGALLNIVLNYFGIKIFGYIAAAYTTLICYVLFSVAHYFYLQYIIRKKANIKSIFNGGIIFLINGFSLLLTFVMILIYKNWILRYTVLLLMAISSIILRKKIVKFIKLIRE